VPRRRFLAYAATRFAELSASLSSGRPADSLTHELWSFYFDTALVGPSGLPSLLAFAPLEQIVFGTDFPYASEAVSKKFTANLDSYHDLAPATLEGIDRRAETLIRRLVTSTEGPPRMSRAG